MDIDNGDSPFVLQNSYTLPIKHAAWVQKDLELLDKIGIIDRSVSPWSSPIVIVPKVSLPGEPPRRRLCVDYRELNKLLQLVTEAHLNAKGMLTLVPLPKLICARLNG